MKVLPLQRLLLLVAFDGPDRVQGSAEGDPCYGSPFSPWSRWGGASAKSIVSNRLLILGWLLGWKVQVLVYTEKRVLRVCCLVPKTLVRLPGLGPWSGCSPVVQEEILR